MRKNVLKIYTSKENVEKNIFEIKQEKENDNKLKKFNLNYPKLKIIIFPKIIINL